MATKLQFYQSVAEQTVDELTRHRGNWLNYLDTAARLYKYPFPDQLMIYSQRPNAVAVAPIELWNEQFNRWVRRGSKGIALIDDSGHFPKLKYVFDVNDTEPSRYNARPVQLWEMRQEHRPLVLAELAKNYEGVSDTLAESFRNIAKVMAQEYYSDNAQDIQYRAENSILEPITAYDFSGTAIEERDSGQLENAFVEALSSSIAYTLMSRCGLDTEAEFEDEDFQIITDFNTPDMVYALGTATNELSKQVLHDIEITVRKYERVKAAQVERSEENYDRNPYLSSSGRLSTPEHHADAAVGGNAARTLRTDEESVPQRPQDNQLQPPIADREAVSAPAGGGTGGDGEVGASDERTNPPERTAEQGARPNGVDGGDERAEIASGGNGGSRTDLRVEPELQQLLSASFISVDEVDSVLRDGGNTDDSFYRIAAYFAKGKNDNAEFLKREYLNGKHGHSAISTGKGFDFGGKKVSAWFDENGITLGIGNSATAARDKVTLSWEQAAERIGQLYNAGQYATPQELENALDNEHLELAGRLWFFYRDDMQFLPDEWNSEHGGYPEDEILIKNLLDNDDERQKIIDKFEVDLTSDSYDQSERHWHNPERLLADLQNTMIVPLDVPQADFQRESFKVFITEDEINSHLTQGSNVSEGKFRILSKFLGESRDKEQIDFLKDEYGTGGGSWHGVDKGHTDHSPGKGITLARGRYGDPDAEITLSWSNVAKRLDSLVRSGQYMSRAELDRMPNYEKIILARTVNNFYSTLPYEDYVSERPFADDNKLYYPDADTWTEINDFLNDGERVNAVIARMEYVFENTPTDDRYFNTRKTAFESLAMFRDGEYTLFPGIEQLPDPETAQIKQAERAREVIDLTDENDRRYSFQDYVPANATQMSLFSFGFEEEPKLPSVEEQRTQIDETLKEEAAEVKAASVVLENDTDELLLNISDENKARIAAQFTANPRSREAVNLFREVYADTLPIPTTQAMKRITELVTEGKFTLDAPKPELNLQAVGDFYELTGGEAQIAADILGLTITPRNGEPMVGFPKSVLDDYLKRLTDAGYAVLVPETLETEKNAAKPYAMGDTLWLDNRKFVIDEIGDYYTQPDDLARKFATFGYRVKLTDITGGYPLSRSMYSAEIDYQLGFDERNAAFTPLGEVAEQPAPEVTAEPEAVSEPITPPEFDTVKQTVYDRVMADADFLENLKTAQSRGALRSPLNAALDNIIGELKAESDAYAEYFTDDIADDLFDHVYKTAWENRPQQQAQPEAEQENAVEPKSNDTTDPDKFMREHFIIGGIDNGNNEPEKPQSQAAPSGKAQNFRITDDHLGEGGTKAKFRANIDAIRLVKELERDNRHATPEEQDTLSRYVGWGGLPQAFDADNPQWTAEYKELLELLPEDEYDSARASTLNAHYTTPVVIKAMWETVERLGFKSGNVLEPSCGVGNFFGLIPQNLWQSKLYGVELDNITAQIAKYLYPNANIRKSGFEKTDTPDAFFDLAIGNVPFGNYGVVDKRYDKHHFHIHDYFFAKTLDQVRPGGVVAFVTSKFTLDKQNPEVRKYIAQRAELLGAVRLPNTTFLKNAGTETTMDILFLQKRDRILDIEPDWVHLGLTEDGLPVNRYFIDNPEMVCGTMALDEGMNNKYGRSDYTACLPIDSADLGEQLKTALLNVRGEIKFEELDDLDGVDDHAIPADSNVKNFSYALVTLTDEPHRIDGQYHAAKLGVGQVYFRENSLMYPVDLPATTLDRIKGMIGLRTCVQELIALQLDEHPESKIKAKQAQLSYLYDKFSADFGLINSTANNRAFNADSSYYLLCSLEILNEDGELERKADMFTKRTIKQKTVITHVDTASEALAVSLGERACVDMDYMSELTGKTEQELFAELRGVIFLDHSMDGNADHYVYRTADEFLSGDVRKKLRKYNDALETLPDDYPHIEAFRDNAVALTAAQPKDLEASDIAVRLGATWIDPEYIEQFMHEMLNTSWRNRSVYQVKYHPFTGEWQVTGKGKSQFSDINATVTYGTGRMNAYQIIDDTLNLRDVRVYDYKEDADGKQHRILNKKETTLAQQKQELIKQAFKDWLWKDPTRRQKLVQEYNEKFNSVRPREYDGSHVSLSGISPEITLKPHQLNAIAHILYGGNTLLAHVVGAGKTFEMVGAAMESKRLGLCQKSLFAVPNHLTEQWAGEFLRLYPSANILVATKKDFEMRNRKKFCAKIATGDYDAVIIGHSQLEKIPMSRERQERLLREQLWELEEGIRELKESNGERFSIKQLEKTKKSLEARLTKLLDSKTRDDVVTFEQLGVDRLFIDEAHGFKNLMLYTKMRNVAGLSTSEAQKSSDLFMKCRYMDELTDGKGIIFATGTPISNSMTEMYTLQRYLQYDTLKRMNLTHFDSWASTFGETQTSIELAPEGNGYRARTRFAKFHNLPELMSVFKDVADIQTADMLNLPVPKADFKTVIVEPSDLQKEMVAELSERAAAVHNREVEPSEDNMLKITTDGRKIGLDQRLINPLLEDFPGSKVNACTDNVFGIWNDTQADRLTQLVFCDFSTPNKDGRFNVYDDIQAKLIERGIPEHEIAFIHDADTENKKKELFAKVRQGKVRVLFGSTFKMGSGTNVQDKLIAIHDADCPWRPSDLEQRAGRIIRQGNTNPEVQIFRYATNGTFDSYLWQTVENKQKFISQIMSSKSPVRSCEDVDETALSYAEIKALCAGNPLIAEKMELDIEVAKLRMLKADHQSQHYRLEDSLLKTFPQQITSIKERISGIETDIAAYSKEKEKCTEVTMTGGAASVSSKFAGMTINGKHYTEKEPAAKALLESCKGVTDKADKPIGDYMGFKMSVRFDSFSQQFSVLLRGQMTYAVDLGTDAFGNITRINNALDSLDKRLEGQKSQLENLNKQQDAAKEELAKPFSLEADLQSKEARLALLNADLNIDGDGGFDVENDSENRDENDGNAEQDEAEYEGDEPEYNEPKVAYTIVNPGATFNYPQQSERVAAYGKAKPDFLESLKNLEGKKQPAVPGNAKQPEHEI